MPTPDGFLLNAVITASNLRDAAGFQDMLGVIDSALWTVDPPTEGADATLSVLIGRPLALIRATLRFTLDNGPLLDLSGWSELWPPGRV